MEIFELPILEIGVSEMYLNQRKLDAVKDMTQQEGFTEFGPLPVHDFGDGKYVLTDGHHRAFVAWQMGRPTLKVYADSDPNTVSKLPQRMYKMCIEWCRAAGVENVSQLQNRIMQPPIFEFFWLERCRRGYNLITTRNKQALDKARELVPDMHLYGTERALDTFYFEDEKGKLFKYYDGELRPERSDND